VFVNIGYLPDDVNYLNLDSFPHAFFFGLVTNLYYVNYVITSYFKYCMLIMFETRFTCFYELSNHNPTPI